LRVVDATIGATGQFTGNPLGWCSMQDIAVFSLPTKTLFA